LIAAMNPCPCGQWGNTEANCLCSSDRITRYLAKLSAPFLDRIDMHIAIQALSEGELLKPSKVTERQSAVIREKVIQVQKIQLDRQNCVNASLNPKACEVVCELGEVEYHFLSKTMTRFKFSARGYHRLLKVARTIADMSHSPKVALNHLQQALAFKQNLQLPK
jgi:magnesium chelatase family protein